MLCTNQSIVLHKLVFPSEGVLGDNGGVFHGRPPTGQPAAAMTTDPSFATGVPVKPVPEKTEK